MLIVLGAFVSAFAIAIGGNSLGFSSGIVISVAAPIMFGSMVWFAFRSLDHNCPQCNYNLNLDMMKPMRSLAWVTLFIDPVICSNCKFDLSAASAPAQHTSMDESPGSAIQNDEAWKDFVRSAAEILDNYQKNKKFPLEAAWALVEEKGAGIDAEIVDFLMNCLSERGADREGFAELVELLKREPSLAEFHEYMQAEATPPIWQFSTRLYSWLANVLRMKRQKP